jgi:hypothetical protein
MSSKGLGTRLRENLRLGGRRKSTRSVDESPEARPQKLFDIGSATNPNEPDVHPDGRFLTIESCDSGAVRLDTTYNRALFAN